MKKILIAVSIVLVLLVIVITAPAPGIVTGTISANGAGGSGGGGGGGSGSLNTTNVLTMFTGVAGGVVPVLSGAYDGTYNSIVTTNSGMTYSNGTLNIPTSLIVKSNGIIPVINVLNYGADNNLGADASAAFQAAINAATVVPVVGTGGRRVFVPAGTYRIVSGFTLAAHVTLEGESAPSSASSSRLYCSTANATMITLASPGYQRIANLDFSSDSAATGVRAISSLANGNSSCTYGQLQNLHFANCGVGIGLHYGWGWDLYSIYGDDCGIGILLSNTVNAIHIYGGKQANTGGIGIGIVGDDCNTIVIESYIEGCKFGILATNAGVGSSDMNALQIDHTHLEANNFHVFIDGGTGLFHHPVLSDNYYTAGGTNVYLRNVYNPVIENPFWSGSAVQIVTAGLTKGLSVFNPSRESVADNGVYLAHSGDIFIGPTNMTLFSGNYIGGASGLTNYGSNLADGSHATASYSLQADGSGGSSWAAGSGGGGYAFLGPFSGVDTTTRAYTGGSASRTFPLTCSGNNSAGVGQCVFGIPPPFTITNFVCGADAAAVGSAVTLRFSFAINQAAAVKYWDMVGTTAGNGQATNFTDSYTVNTGTITNMYSINVSNAAASGASGTIGVNWSFQVIK